MNQVQNICGREEQEKPRRSSHGLVLFWLLFVVIFLFLPLGYGWGYRGWGRPYPSSYRSQRRTPPPPGGPYRENTVVSGEPYPPDVVVAEEEDTWGALADIVWIAVVIAVGWLLFAWIF